MTRPKLQKPINKRTNEEINEWLNELEKWYDHIEQTIFPPITCDFGEHDAGVFE